MIRAEKLEGIVLISKPTIKRLDEKRLIRYREFRKPYIEWLRTEGKDPSSLQGYADDTAYMYASITDKWARWVWDRQTFSLQFTHDDALDYLKDRLNEAEHSRTHCSNVRLALKTYFEWDDRSEEWDPDITVSGSKPGQQPKDYLSRDEREKVREAVLEYATVPAYHAMDPQQRSDWKAHLARRFGKPASEIGPADFERANGYKYPSLVFASLDAGLRPVEVGRATTNWVNADRAVLNIPSKEAAKSDQNWEVSIRHETAEFLRKWLEERYLYEKYDDTDALWLTRHGNPYKSSSLQVLLDNLKEIAGIERHLSWYAIRHSVGTHISDERGLAAAASQLRHVSETTTMKYDNVSTEDRRDALDNIG